MEIPLKILTLLLLFQPLSSCTRQPPEVLGQRLDPLPQDTLSAATWTNDACAPEHSRQHPCLGQGPGMGREG
ncbi:hypothetical protein AV530_015795 [Patagioenas fasciata monilis]|uniref:Uncharacterized protein n=1 Tax=Patagioenas fasciata monilis TaxID=372326 RepID=A0A1V4KIQ8_PATFA|nr:hypothetical protein AV530_015795 [Patagioenas fasciata monilis]